MIRTEIIEATRSSAKMTYSLIVSAQKETMYVCKLLLIVCIYSVKSTVNNDCHWTPNGIKKVELDSFEDICQIHRGNAPKIFGTECGNSRSFLEVIKTEEIYTYSTHKRSKVEPGVENTANHETYTNAFARKYFPTEYSKISFRSTIDMSISKHLDKIETTVNQAANTGNHIKLGEYINNYRRLLSKYPKSSRLLIQLADSLALQSHFTNSSSLHSEAVINFHKALSLENISDTHFEILANRSLPFSYFDYRENFVDELKKKVGPKFPHNIHDLIEPGTTYSVLGSVSKTIQKSEKACKLASRDEFTLIGCLGRLGEWLIFNWLVPTRDKIHISLQNVKYGLNLLLKAIEAKHPSVMKGLILYICGYSLARLGRIEESNKIFHISANLEMHPSFWQRSLYSTVGLISKPVWNLQQTNIDQELSIIANKWRHIRREALTVLRNKKYVGQTEGIRDTGKWGIYKLYDQGKRIDGNCENAPTTCSLVDTIPQISSTPFGQVKFSIMKAGTHVYPHTSMTNTRIRIHLGLKLPSQRKPMIASNSLSRIRVLNEYFAWEEGKMIIFDDSFDHEVWHFHPQNKSRLVLIIDMIHPNIQGKQY